MRIRNIAATVTALIAMMSVVLGGAPAQANPANDDFANATVVPSLPYLQTSDTTGATTEPNEPDAHSSCASAGASIWYSYTAPDATKLTASTQLSKISALVGVYTGPSLDNLSLVGCDTQVSFVPAPGTTYYFQVGDTEVDSSGNFFSVAGIVTFDLNLYAPEPACDGCPGFNIYVAPNTITNANGAGETSIGIAADNAAMFLMTTTTAHVSWDDKQNPPVATWTNASAPETNKITFDPILWTDPVTHRTFVAQDLPASPAIAGAPAPVGVGSSIMAYSDDGGATWIPEQPPVTESWDHESVGGGPYPATLPLGVNPVYPHAVYYCSQDVILFSWCVRSDDGGLTWGQEVPAGSPTAGCQSLHGHIQVAPNGNVYVPYRFCSAGGHTAQGFLMSTNAGATWSPTSFPGVTPGHFDPAMAFDQAGRGYYIANSGDGHPYVMVSDTNGQSWSKPFDVGYPYHIRNSEFAMATAGSDGRAAVAFYGTPTEGNDQASDFAGAFHLYVAFTYDAGQTWQTEDLTPTDPVQRGCIWASGGNNPCRNLLDFQGITIDKFGRVLIGYADGCTRATCIGPKGTPANSRDSRGTIARQTTGKSLLAQYDSMF